MCMPHLHGVHHHRTNGYQAVVQFLPTLDQPEQVRQSKRGLPVEELVRMTNTRGFVILGAPSAHFEAHYREPLLRLSDPSSRDINRGRFTLNTLRPKGTRIPQFGSEEYRRQESSTYKVAVFTKGDRIRSFS